MFNILNDAANWSGSDGVTTNQPPVWWNGTTYDYIGSIGTGEYPNGASMTYIGTISAGDIIAFDITSTSADPTEFDVTVNGVKTYSQTLATNVPYTYSQIFVGGETVIVNLGVGDNLYSQDAILTPTANPPPTPPPPVAQVMLRWSDDGCHTFSNPQIASQGTVGETAQRVIWRRIGSTRRNTGLDRVFEVSSDDPTQVALVGASIGDG